MAITFYSNQATGMLRSARDLLERVSDEIAVESPAQATKLALMLGELDDVEAVLSDRELAEAGR